MGHILFEPCFKQDPAGESPVNSYVGVLGTGLLFGGVTAWAVKMWGT